MWSSQIASDAVPQLSWQPINEAPHISVAPAPVTLSQIHPGQLVGCEESEGRKSWEKEWKGEKGLASSHSGCLYSDATLLLAAYQ